MSGPSRIIAGRYRGFVVVLLGPEKDVGRFMKLVEYGNELKLAQDQADSPLSVVVRGRSITRE